MEHTELAAYWMIVIRNPMTFGNYQLLDILIKAQRNKYETASP